MERFLRGLFRRPATLAQAARLRELGLNTVESSTISWEGPSRVTSRRLNLGSEPETRQILRPAILGMGGRTGAVRIGAWIMAHMEFSKEITALLVIDPYNEFISATQLPGASTLPGRCSAR